MKKLMVVAAVVAALALALGTARFAFAESPVRPTAPAGLGVRGGPGGPGLAGQEGPMHDAMIASMAKALNLDAATLEQRLDAGETMWSIAQSQGLSADQFSTAMQQARNDALKQAVADGSISQAQADWMSQRMAYGLTAGNQARANGLCDGTGMHQGRGMGGRWSAPAQ